MESTPVKTDGIERDGRLYLLAILGAYFGAIIIASQYMPFHEFWRYLQVQALPDFEDMHCVTYDGEAILNGQPTAFCFFYPPAMYWFAHLGLRESHTFAAALTLNISFFVVLLLQLGRIRPRNAFLYGALICSPPIMLGVSRANVDLFVFILLCGALFLTAKAGWTRVLGYGLVCYASLLKLNPIFASILAMRERGWKRRLVVILVLCASLLLYLLCNRDYFRQMFANFPTVRHLAFGAPIIFHRIFKAAVPAYATSLALLLCVLVAVLSLRGAAKDRAAFANETDENDARLQAFRVGAAMYCGCFALVQYNFYYRFVFLLLTVPQWLAWWESKGPLAKLAFMVLAAMLIGFWLPRYEYNFVSLDQAADWFLFYACARAFLASAPSDIQRTLRIAPRPAGIIESCA